MELKKCQFNSIQMEKKWHVVYLPLVMHDGKIVLNLRDRKKESSRWLMWQLAVEEKTFHKRSVRKLRKPKEDCLLKTSLLTNFASRKIETFEKRSKNSCTRLHFYNQNISLAVQKSQWIKKAPQKDIAGPNT